MRDFSYTIYNEYAAGSFYDIINTFAQAAGIDQFTDTFLTKVWDINTCEDWALDIWGTVVNISRYVKPAISEDLIFGFDEAKDPNPAITNYPTPFNNGAFYAGISSNESLVRLGTAAYRAFIISKAFANLTIATIPQINQFIRLLLPDRPESYCEDTRKFNINIYTSYVTAAELALIYSYDILPVSSCTKVTVIIPPAGIRINKNEKARK